MSWRLVLYVFGHTKIKHNSHIHHNHKIQLLTGTFMWKRVLNFKTNLTQHMQKQS